MFAITILVAIQGGMLDEFRFRQHVQSHIRGHIVHFDPRRSSRGGHNAIVQITSEVSAKSAIQPLKETNFEGRHVHVEVLKSQTHGVAPISTTALSTATPLVRHQQQLAGVETGLQGNMCCIKLIVSKISWQCDFEKLKHHIRSHVGGTIQHFEVLRSKRGGCKCIVSIMTHCGKEAAITRLRKARFQGKFIDVEVSAELVPSLTSVEEKENTLSLHISNLLPSVGEEELRHHIRSQVGGKVWKLDMRYTLDSCAAVAVVETVRPPDAVVTRLSFSRFRSNGGYPLFVRLLSPPSQMASRDANSTLPARDTLRILPEKRDIAPPPGFGIPTREETSLVNTNHRPPAARPNIVADYSLPQHTFSQADQEEILAGMLSFVISDSPGDLQKL